GIALFSGAAIAIGWCSLPEGTRFSQLIGVGFLAGIGFTMSIFITLLAFDDPAVVVNAKTAILVSSLVAALVGAFWIRRTLSAPPDALR
ncbi:MAG: Na+/H+ antiporter NhaA, partial [Flavobacteriales bacterium]|nr:Na+/H+ antiporter NhaA [Flavobacteriales bacterium]